jgi:NTE family protein
MSYRHVKASLSHPLLVLPLLAILGLPGVATLAAAAPEQPRVGLVLGGGGARGMAHVGVLRLLEELRVPVTCIAGTSMGSIVGGLYAAGMTAEDMEQTLRQINWPDVFRDGPPRAERPIRFKQEQRILQSATGEIGLRRGQAIIQPKELELPQDPTSTAPVPRRAQVILPKGLLQGQNLSLLLEELALPAAGVSDFDQLTVPYRAVATDLETGRAVVLGSGNLAQAMRASMSIPSALAPIELDGKLLVDGGVANNLPIDVVRELCRPEVIIAVDVGAPLAPASELTSVLSVTNQLTSILTVRNVEEQIQTLRPTDILLVPDLGDLSSIAFNRSPEAVTIGYAAAATQRERLARFSLSPAAYQAHLAARPSLPAADDRPIIDFIHIQNNTRLSDQVIQQQLDVRPGDRLDPRQLSRTLNKIHGMGEFQEVTYSLVEEEGRTGLIVKAEARHIGTDTLQFGLFMGTNLQGESKFSINMAYTMAQLNALGGQWRNIAQLGSDIILATDFYQPLDADQEYFINPYLRYERYDLSLTQAADGSSAEYRVNRTALGVEAGRNLERWGRLALGLDYSAGSTSFRRGQRSPADEGSFDGGGFSLSWTKDTLDSVDFPTSGSFQNVIYHNSPTALGADNTFQTLDLTWTQPYTLQRSTLIPRIRLAGRLDGTLGIQDLFRLGGFLNLSGFQTGEVSGEYIALGQLIYMHRLNDASAAFSLPLFAGGSLEVGGAWNDIDEIDLDSLIPAGSLFVGADTPLGPAYLGGGYAQGGNASLYLLLGRLF